MHPNAILSDLNSRIVVCGAGGFIGGHLVRHFLKIGYRHVRAVDIKPVEAWYQSFQEAQNVQLDLRDRRACTWALQEADLVFNLAADGENAPDSPQSVTMLNTLINTHLLMAASESPTCRNYVFASSASVYSQDAEGTEASVYPANPGDQSGWEKLFSERMCQQFMLDFGVATYVARLHHTYGAHCSLEGGGGQTLVDICKRVASAKLNGDKEVEIRGSADDRHCWTHVDDCVLGLTLLVRAGIHEPVNMGSGNSVTTRQIVEAVQEIAGTRLKAKYMPEMVVQAGFGPSENSFILKEMNWQPSTELLEGIESTYRWIHDEVAKEFQVEEEECEAAPASDVEAEIEAEDSEEVAVTAQEEPEAESEEEPLVDSAPAAEEESEEVVNGSEEELEAEEEEISELKKAS